MQNLEDTEYVKSRMRNVFEIFFKDSLFLKVSYFLGLYVFWAPLVAPTLFGIL